MLVRIKHAEETTAHNMQLDDSSSSEEAKLVKTCQEEDESREEEYDPVSLNDVYEALDDLSSPGSTCTGGVACDLPCLPGLFVDGVGVVPLPLTPEAAEKLKSVSHQAPHGRGLETVVDTSVRNTLQVDAGKVSLKNPNWKSAFTTLTRNVVTALGVNANLVRPELYKLLLYEEGGFFKKHRDTEKSAGMFATLVVQLPSIFEGGSFIVSHGGKSQTFEMATDTAPYSCQYVAHYADCEHEIQPVKSGYRLALIYSLCYTGSEVSKPSAQGLQEGGLVSVINQLESEDGLFAIPLEHQYTQVSLARLGIGALKGTDRKLAQTISGADGWDMIVAEIERTDLEFGSGGGGGYHDYGFEMEEVEKGDPHLVQLFHQDGKDASEHKMWIDRQLKMSSVEDDGMILADEEGCEEMWGNVDYGAVEYTGNAGASRDTTYHSYILIVFMKAGTFERICKSNFNDAMKIVTEDSKYISRAVEYISRAKPSISSEQFLQLQPLILEAEPNRGLYFKILMTLVECLQTMAVPSEAATSLLASLVKANASNELTEKIRNYMQKLTNIGGKSLITCADLLKLANFILFFNSALGTDSSFPSLLKATLAQFDEVTEKKLEARTHRFQSYRELQPIELGSQLETFAQKYGSGNVEGLVKSCFLRIRKKNEGFDNLAEEILALRVVSAKGISVTTANGIRNKILEDFVAIVEGKHTSTISYPGRTISNPDSVWSHQKIDVIVRELFTHGTEEMFHRIKAWASGAARSSLNHAAKALMKMNAAKITCSSIVAKDDCVKYVQDQNKKLIVAHYMKHEAKLLRDTKSGKPVFSWRMPSARTGSAAIDAHLHSNADGRPTEITVGKGINFARSLAKCHVYGNYGIAKISNDPFISKGFSAVIKNTSKIGSSASVVVTKTKELYNVMVQKYDKNIKDLVEVQAKIRKYGGQPSRPVQEPPAKKLRTDIEVIVID